MNVLAAIGRLGNDAEVAYTQAGKPVLNFSLAVDSGWGDRKVTTWWRCALFGERGEKLAEHLKKGDSVGVVGEPTLREYEHKGEKRTSLDLRVSEITLIGGKPKEARSSGGGGQSPPQRDVPPLDDEGDDIPFISPFGTF